MARDLYIHLGIDCRDVRCPHCGRERGQDCEDATGRPLYVPHGERVQASEQQFSECMTP